MKDADLTHQQRAVLQLMAARPDRDLYEGSAPPSGRHGSGRFWLTYSADEKYDPLGWPDVHKLTADGLIEELWPGCYKLAGAKREPVRRIARR